jgi:protein-L-isoaspartate(D-aspartate) O-methyltransferase
LLIPLNSVNYSGKSYSSIQNMSAIPMAVDGVSDRIRLVMKLRRSGIRDATVLSAMEAIPRDLFVEEMFVEHAYDDTALPINCGQTISQPTIVARMTEALLLKPRMKVLEIGTGSGYQAAILAKLSRMVYTIERHRDLLAVAEQRFLHLRITNIVTKRGDGSKGWKEAAPFERIIVTAAADNIPGKLVDQLAVGGVMVIPVGENVAQQELLRLTKSEDGKTLTETLMDVRFVPLIAEK